MRLIRKINNNVVFAKDAHDKEVLVVGRGLGFLHLPKIIPHDDSRIEKVYVLEADNGRMAALFEEVPTEVILLSDKIIKNASKLLNCEFQNSLLLTLADHINFAIERKATGIEIDNPLHWDVLEIYPQEVEVARNALEMIAHELGVFLPEVEVTFIALHLSNAYSENKTVSKAQDVTKAVKTIINIIKQAVPDIFPTDSIAYKRLLVHIRYFVVRQIDQIELQGENEALYELVIETMPKAWEIAKLIDKEIGRLYNWNCSKSESAYLTLHIHKLISM